jgi:hypothetical protein
MADKLVSEPIILFSASKALTDRHEADPLVASCTNKEDRQLWARLVAERDRCLRTGEKARPGLSLVFPELRRAEDTKMTFTDWLFAPLVWVLERTLFRT